MIPLNEVFQFLCDFAPLDLAEKWDVVGLQVGSLQAKVSGILVALDCTEEVVQEAIALKANCIITHHPLFFQPLRALNETDPVSRVALSLARHSIHLLSFHTNLDSTREGLNDLLARQIGLRKTSPLLPAAKNPKVGLGRIGSLKPALTFESFLRHLGRKLSIRDFRVVGTSDPKISRVAVMTGSGAEYFRPAKERGAQVLVTGDVKYHTALEALAEKIALIDVGHFASEIGMVKLIADQLKGWSKRSRKKIQVHETKVMRDPFRFFVGKHSFSFGRTRKL